MKKRLLAIVLAMVMCLAMAAPALAVSQGPTSGTCGENVTWNFDESSGTLTISGTGEMVLFPAPTWGWHEDKITTVVINNGVTSIGNSAFYRYPNLTSVTIPDSVTSIEIWAFQDCTSLTSITIPDSVTTIGSSAFQGCTGLTSITIPNSVTTIGSWAFGGCTGLTSVTIPASVTTIWGGAFSYCDSLTTIEVDSGNQNYVSVDGVLFSKDMKTLAAYPNGKQGSSYTIPNGVTNIEADVFYSCSRLTSLTIPASVTTIGEDVLFGCDSIEVYYTGTEAQWKDIVVYSGMYGAYLPPAEAIHYNSTGTTPEPAPSPIDAYQFSPWAKSQLTAAFDAGLVPENVLNKDLTAGVTRAQFAAVAVKLYEAMSGEKVPAVSENPFDDTSDPYVLQAYSLGLVSGNGSGGFSPDGSLTREMAARLLSNVFTKLGGQIPTAGETQFADDGKISSWARDAVSFMSQKGIVNGSGGSFMPGGDMTGEGAVILAVQMLQNLEV